jgi:hypothetical protein
MGNFRRSASQEAHRSAEGRSAAQPERPSCSRILHEAAMPLTFRIRLILLASALLAISPSLARAQNDDGGVTYTRGEELLESIYVPNLTNAPFSLTLATEWSRPMQNGGTYTIVNSRPIKRDSAGRIYMERWLLSPKGSNIPSQMSWIQIEDPVAHTYYECSARQHLCELTTVRSFSIRRYDPAAVKSGPFNNGKGSRTHEDLGERFFAGVRVHSYRDTITVNAGALGNDLAMSTVREFQYSPELAINLTSVLDTPQVGRQSFTVTEISTTEPDPKFFQPPDGYKVVDHRTPPANVRPGGPNQ